MTIEAHTKHFFNNARKAAKIAATTATIGLGSLLATQQANAQTQPTTAPDTIAQAQLAKESLYSASVNFYDEEAKKWDNIRNLADTTLFEAGRDYKICWDDNDPAVRANINQYANENRILIDPTTTENNPAAAEALQFLRDGGPNKWCTHMKEEEVNEFLEAYNIDPDTTAIADIPVIAQIRSKGGESQAFPITFRWKNENLTTEECEEPDEMPTPEGTGRTPTFTPGHPVEECDPENLDERCDTTNQNNRNDTSDNNTSHNWDFALSAGGMLRHQATTINGGEAEGTSMRYLGGGVALTQDNADRRVSLGAEGYIGGHQLEDQSNLDAKYGRAHINGFFGRIGEVGLTLFGNARAYMHDVVNKSRPGNNGLDINAGIGAGKREEEWGLGGGVALARAQYSTDPEFDQEAINQLIANGILPSTIAAYDGDTYDDTDVGGFLQGYINTRAFDAEGNVSILANGKHRVNINLLKSVGDHLDIAIGYHRIKDAAWRESPNGVSNQGENAFTAGLSYQF